jgi:L-ascorbate 6-phosphate lactonase
LIDIGGIRFFHAGDGLVYPGLPVALSELAPDVLLLPINGRDHMRESAGIVGNMNESEAAWLCARVNPSYVIPMHYDAIEGNTGDPGHFVAMAGQAGSLAAVLIPARGRPVTLTLP